MTENTDSSLTYACIFCGKSIEPKKGHALDPCALLLVGNFDAARSGQLQQEFYCHLECFRSRMNQPAGLYIDELKPEDQA